MSARVSSNLTRNCAGHSIGRRFPRTLFLLLAMGIPVVSFVFCSRGPDRAPAEENGTPNHRIAEHSESKDSVLWRVEMAKDATKTEMESVARTLLASAPTDRTRLVEFYLGPLGPFNPTYASIRVEPGQTGAGQGLFFHMH